MRVDEGRNSWGLLAIKTKADTVLGKGEKGLLTVTTDLSCVMGGERGKKSPKVIEGVSKKTNNAPVLCQPAPFPSV